MPDEHSEIWAAIDKMRGSVMQQATDTASFIGECRSVIEFIRAVQMDACPMGKRHGEQLANLTLVVQKHKDATAPVIHDHTEIVKLKWAAMLLVIGAIITTGGGAFISWHNAEVAEAARAVVTRELNVLRSQQPYADPPVTAPVTPAKGLAPTSRSKADTPKTTQPQTGIVTRMRKPAPKAGG